MEYFNQLLSSYNLLKKRKLSIPSALNEEEKKKTKPKPKAKGETKEKDEVKPNPNAEAAATEALKQVANAVNQQGLQIRQMPDMTGANRWGTPEKEGDVGYLGLNDEGGKVVLWKTSPQHDIMMMGSQGTQISHVGTAMGQPGEDFKILVDYFAGHSDGVSDQPMMDPELQRAVDKLVITLNNYTDSSEGLGNLERIATGEIQGSRIFTEKRIAENIPDQVLNTTEQPEEVKLETVNLLTKTIETGISIDKGATGDVSHEVMSRLSNNLLITPHGVRFGDLFFTYIENSSAENDPLRAVADKINDQIKDWNEKYKSAPDYTKINEIPVLETTGGGAGWRAKRGVVAESHLPITAFIMQLDQCGQEGAQCDKKTLSNIKGQIKQTLQNAMKAGTAEEMMEWFKLGGDIKLQRKLFDSEGQQTADFVEEIRSYFLDTMGVKESTVDKLFEVAGNKLGMALVVYAHAVRKFDVDLFKSLPPIKGVEGVGQAKEAKEYGTKADVMLCFDSNDVGKATQALNKKLGKQSLDRQSYLDKKHPSLVGVGTNSLFVHNKKDNTSCVGVELKTLDAEKSAKGVGEASRGKRNDTYKEQYASDREQKFFDEQVKPNFDTVGGDWSSAQKKNAEIDKAISPVVSIISRKPPVTGVPRSVENLLAQWKSLHKNDVNWDNDKYKQILAYVNNPGGTMGDEPDIIKARLKAFNSWKEKIVQEKITSIENNDEGVDSTTQTSPKGGWKNYHLANIAMAALADGDVVKDYRSLAENKQGVYLNNAEILYAIDGCYGPDRTHVLKRTGNTIHIINAKDRTISFTGSYERGRLKVTSGKDVGHEISGEELTKENIKVSEKGGDLMIEFLKAQQKIIDQLLA